MISDILGLFANTLTADDKYSLHNRKNLPKPIQMQLSKKLKKFSRFFAAFLNLPQILNILKKNVTLICYVYLQLETAADVVR